ncbi:MAG: phage holin family protein [bacterium]|nr:phage holin family protein [Acidimicrobiia bacterium]MCY4650321.1 phage holin family protein [bacterium]
MADPRELPQQVADLIELAKRYLRQETVDPLRRIGQSVGRAVMAALLVGLGVVMVGMGLHRFLAEALPKGQWWEVAASAIVVVVFLLAATIVARRVRTDSE